MFYIQCDFSFEEKTLIFEYMNVHIQICLRDRKEDGLK